MERLNGNGTMAEYGQYETPFSDIAVVKDRTGQFVSNENFFQGFTGEVDSPFSRTYEAVSLNNVISLAGEEYVDFLSELNDSEFSETIYELANEVEDTWRNKVSNEIAMGSNFIPFAAQQAQQYFIPVIRESEAMIDRVAQHFSGNNLADHSEAEIEHFFDSLEFDHEQYSPAQEQFFGSLFNKVKSVVSKGVELAKKGASFVGKFMPLNIILGKIKGLIKPLLDKVLKFAIGKLPKNLQPYAQTLARKFLNLETGVENEDNNSNEQPENELDSIQTEFDNHVAQLLFSPGEQEAQNLVSDYEFSLENVERTNNYETGFTNMVPLHVGRRQFIDDLKNLREGESPAPAIERFLPIAIAALQPVIKMAMGLIGRQKIVNFLAGLLAKLVGKYVPAEVATPLSTSIVDIGMKVIGFETYETGRSDLAFEAIANTIEETVQNMNELNETSLNDSEDLTMQLLEAFETAAANNFPPHYIKSSLRPTKHKALWISMPRNAAVQLYKKFTHVYDITIDPQSATAVTTFRGLPLANFLRDKYGLNPANPIKAKVHLYEVKKGTRLSEVSKHEKLPGLNARQPKAWIQLLPLTQKAASLLLKEPSMGKEHHAKHTATRFKATAGQRFYYLEIDGVRLRIPPVNRSTHNHRPAGQAGQSNVHVQDHRTGQQTPSNIVVHDHRTGQPDHGNVTVHDHRTGRPNQGNVTVHDHRTKAAPVAHTESRSADIHGVINFIKSEIKLNYYFSEEDAKAVVEKLNKNDFLGAAVSVRQSVKNVLNDMLIKNVSTKVKIVHEAIPELYLEHYNVEQNQLSPMDVIGKVAGKEVVSKLVEKLVDVMAAHAYNALVNFFKARAAEFKTAQAQPQDGVTVKLTWSNIQGMAAVRKLINAIHSSQPVGNLSDISIPHLPVPDIKVFADKKFN